MSGRSWACAVWLYAWQAVIMCGRYANARTKAQIALDFQVAEEYVEVKDNADYNVTPQKRAPIVLTAAPPEDQAADAVRQVRLALWGLRPGFLKPEQRGFPNARVEGLAEKRSFAKPLRERRILVPMDGFYEWWNERDETGKEYRQPYYFTPKDGGVLALAGSARVLCPPNQPGHSQHLTAVRREVKRLLDGLHAAFWPFCEPLEEPICRH
jgi:putative SOS response-associated peptidase YedK